MKKNSKNTATIKKILSYLKRYWLLIGLSLFCAAVTVVLTLYLPGGFCGDFCDSEENGGDHSAYGAVPVDHEYQ